MDDPVRLFGRLYLHHKGSHVAAIKIRVQAPVPIGAVIRVTDLQLQPGAHITGWTLHPSDLGVQAVTGWEWRNAVVSGDQTVVIAADVASASPTVWDVRGGCAAVQIGAFTLGDVYSWARVDGARHEATQGAGLPPHLTARSDIDVPIHVTGRTLACCWLRGLSVPSSTPVLPPVPVHVDGPLRTVHAGWGALLAVHATWALAVAAHPDWS